MMATGEVPHEDKESNRKKFSNWLQCVHSLKETKTALHDHVLETFKEELISWDSKAHIPQFLRCVAEDRIEIRNTNSASRKGNAKREWHCNCEHSDCNKIVKKLLTLQQNPGFNIVWNTEICKQLANNELNIEVDEDDQMDNIPTVETTSVWAFFKRLFDLIGLTFSKQAADEVKYEDIFDGCTQVHVWCIANMFMQRGKNKTNIINTDPGNTDASMFFKMMMNCKLFEIVNENYLYDNVKLCRDRLHHSANNRVGQVEAQTYLNTMIKLLEKFEHVAKCKTATQNIQKMLQETIVSVSVPNENLKRLRQEAEEALKEKKTALEVDQEIDKTSGLSNDETSGLLEETKEQLDSISKSQPIEVLNDKMKSREDYKREQAEYAGYNLKTMVAGQSEHSSCTDRVAKDPIKHFKKMMNLVESFQSNSDIVEAVTAQLNPVLDQIVEIASKKDEKIKESLEEVYHQEEQELLEQTQISSSEFDTRSLFPQRKQDNKFEDQDLKDNSANNKVINVRHNAGDKSLNLDDKSANDFVDNFVNNDVNDTNNPVSTNQIQDDVSTFEAAALGHSSVDQNHRYLWSVVETQQCSVRVEGDSIQTTFFTCCRVSRTEILLADRVNKKLKKLDNSYQVVIEVLDLDDWPFDICYIGDNECVVALPKRKLQFVDVTDKMSLGKSIHINHDCSGLAYYNNYLYVIDKIYVYIYSTDGAMQTVLYTHPSANSVFRHIAVSDDGGKIYITGLKSGLVTIDKSGKYMNTTGYTELGGTWGVCVDSRGHVLVCGQNSTKILQISSDGKQKIGTMENNLNSAVDNTALYFDRQNDVLITAGSSGTVTILTLQ